MSLTSDDKLPRNFQRLCMVWNEFQLWLLPAPQQYMCLQQHIHTLCHSFFEWMCFFLSLIIQFLIKSSIPSISIDNCATTIFFLNTDHCGNDRLRVNIQIQLNVYWRCQSVSIDKQNLLLSITHFNYGVKSFILYANVALIPLQK